MKDLLDTAIIAALNAGKAILEVYYSGDFDVEIKKDNSPLTKADKASQNVMIYNKEELLNNWFLVIKNFSNHKSRKIKSC